MDKNISIHSQFLNQAIFGSIFFSLRVILTMTWEFCQIFFPAKEMLLNSWVSVKIDSIRWRNEYKPQVSAKCEGWNPF